MGIHDSTVIHFEEFSLYRNTWGHLFSTHFRIETMESGQIDFMEYGGGKRLFTKRYNNIEEMRHAYRSRVIDGWSPFKPEMD